MAIGKKSNFGAKKPAAKPEAKTDTHSHAELEAKVAALEAKVAELEANTKLLADAADGVDKVKVEIKELQENAKSWASKKKEAMDVNQDGKVDFNEIYRYVWNRLQSRHPGPNNR